MLIPAPNRPITDTMIVEGVLQATQNRDLLRIRHVERYSSTRNGRRAGK